jgi:hypothetical protein
MNFEDKQLMDSGEDLFTNSIVMLGANMIILNHPDVRGVHVKRHPSGSGAIVNLYLHRRTPALELLIKEEYGGNDIRYHDAELWPEIPAGQYA